MEPSFRNKTACCLTGHRPPDLPDGGDPSSPRMASLRLSLIRAVEAAADAGVTTFYAGGARGFDLLAGDAVLALRGNRPEVRLRLALPSKTQAERYPVQDRARYREQLLWADDVWYASEDNNGPMRLLARDRYMVEQSDCCIAYLAKMQGGTFYTVQYALERGLPVQNLALPAGVHA